MVHANSWYISMHFDRLSEELLEGFQNNIDDTEDSKNDKKTANPKRKK
ncbi:hypothetical protein NsoK4_04825 [Nitrosopumilus sp. K4]|nr:hypothetical protein [Nitrosopumilus sp. K4]QUC65561.1 hypothetical protein NsoK4_04825 [Nitrosopumilus sp. K4]